MNEKYEMRAWQDNIFAIYLKDVTTDYVYKGTIEECNAWIDLQSKAKWI